MFKHYLKTAIRGILEKKFYSVIVIIGFTLGIAGWIFVSLWMDDEKKIMGLGENEIVIYRIGTLSLESSEILRDSNGIETPRCFPETPFPLAPYLKKNVPWIIDAFRFGYFGDKFVEFNGKTDVERRFAYADKDFFKLYKFPVLLGSLSDFEEDAFSVVITKSTADKYFKGENPIGKRINVNNIYKLRVAAVIKDIHHFYKTQFDFLARIALIRDTSILNDWSHDRVNTYITVKKSQSIAGLNIFIDSTIKQFNPKFDDKFQLYKLQLLHTYADIREDAGIGGSIQFIYIFSILALFIIFIACTNYFNISFTRFANRAKEIAVRKAFGANKKEIIIQFLVEGQILAFVSLVFAIILIWIVLPYFNSASSKAIQFNILQEQYLIVKCVLITILIGLFSSSYPAFYFSALPPVKIFSSSLKVGAGGVLFRQFISFAQFAIYTGLLIGTFKVDKQLNLLRNTKVGYDYTVSLALPFSKDISNNLKHFENDLRQNPDFLDLDTTSKNLSSINNSRNSEILIVKFKAKHVADNISFTGELWRKYDKLQPFEYSITDLDLSRQFIRDTIMSRLFRYFAIAAAFISLLGFFCFSSFISEQRQSEIAIRKTFGATSLNIYFLLIREFLVISLLAIFTAHFTVAFTSARWLAKFTQRIGDFGVSEYVIPTAVSFVLLILTVSYHAIKASRKEPAAVLKRE